MPVNSEFNFLFLSFLFITTYEDKNLKIEDLNIIILYFLLLIFTGVRISTSVMYEIVFLPNIIIQQRPKWAHRMTNWRLLILD